MSQTPEEFSSHKGQSIEGAGLMAMKIFLVTLAVPFVTCIVAAIVLRNLTQENPEFNWGPAAGSLPIAVWFSTAMVILVSVAAHLCLKKIRGNHVEACRKWVWITTLLALLFAVSQVIALTQMSQLNPEIVDSDFRYKIVFYLLAGLHGLHVLGGFVLEFWILRGLKRSYYDSTEHSTVHYAAIYWHFVDGMWLLLFASLLLLQ